MFSPICCAKDDQFMKLVVEHEDRSRNIMVFGLPEEENEQLNERVLELFEVLGEKPRLDACRVGKKSIESSSTKRPIKSTAV